MEARIGDTPAKRRQIKRRGKKRRTREAHREQQVVGLRVRPQEGVVVKNVVVVVPRPRARRLELREGRDPRRWGGVDCVE